MRRTLALLSRLTGVLPSDLLRRPAADFFRDLEILGVDLEAAFVNDGFEGIPVEPLEE